MSRKSRTQSSPSVVERLIDQRRLIKEWLDKLDGGQAEAMPAHVVERVRNDYVGRLAAVTSELGEHADGVRQSLAESQARHEALESDQTARRDELAELRLRRQVGEVDDARFKEQHQRLKTALDELAKELTASLREIDRLEEILDIMAGGDAARTPEPGRPGDAEADDVEDTAIDAKDDEREEPAEEEEEEKEAPAVKPRASKAVRPEPAPPPAAKPSGARAGAKPAAAQVDELSFLRSVTGVIPATKVPPTKGGDGPTPPVAAAAEPEASVTEPPAAEAAAAAPEAGEKPFFVLDQLPERATADAGPAAAPDAVQGERTLACSECGAFNLPTEWYCEKCGAELSTF